MASGRTLLYGLIGDPVSHSLSPFIMNRALRAVGLDAVYVAFGIRPDTLSQAIGGFAAAGAMGINVTFPFKEQVLYDLDAVSSDAELVQAVNTLILDDDEIAGYNTDAPGTASALEQFTDVEMEGNHAFIFGGGGSARAAAYGLLERGFERVTFAVRSGQKAEMIVDRFHYAFPEQSIDFVVLGEGGNRERRRRAFRDAGVVINATPVGMAGVDNGLLIEDTAWIHRAQCLFDFVYHPQRTPFLQAARSAGAKTLGGTALLVSQALESFRLWTDETFDVREMASAVESFAQRGAKRQREVN